MPRTEAPVQYLLTLPPRMAAEFEALAGRQCPGWFATCDPPGQPLGSGGGTANLLAEAWRATAPGESFDNWLRQSRKLILHAGGLSRRLPAYAPAGKLLMPIPVFRWSRGQRLDQTLLDLTPAEWFHVELDYNGATRTLTTTVTNGGAQYGQTQTILVPTNFDFRATAISISSYSDQHATGSIFAQGAVRAAEWMLASGRTGPLTFDDFFASASAAGAQPGSGGRRP